MADETLPALPLAEYQPARRTIPWRAVAMLAGTVALTLGLLLVPGDIVARLGAFGYAGVFLLVLLASATIVLPSPALGVALLAGKTLDPWLVGLLSGTAAGLGEITGYLVGRGGSELALRSRHYLRVERWVARWGTLTIFILAAVPSPAMDLAGIAAGALRMPLPRFLAACLAGKIVRFVGVAWAGSLLASAGIM